MTSYYPTPSYSAGPRYTNHGADSSSSFKTTGPYTSASRGDVSNAVRSLLTSTQKLQDALKLWSLEQTSEADVSDVYMQIGHQFNAVIDAFAYYQIELSDLHDVPTDLRVVLENCLGEDPSPDVVHRYTPDLHRVLFKLLRGLQNRQEEWRLAASQHASRVGVH
ncbi:hypothetical protein D9613_006601 [Agrocybe pediades]|uniref:Aip3p/Bud6 N-terminal domain-containing protein n=1 Tax=Agrocybe pediades TaxID=84607 RepID=A0A8H4QHW4_9AGAR|nr:hypothetical protein D9613_006601 [Agrocybe pediades]